MTTTNIKETRVWIEVSLLNQIKKLCPKTKGMTYAGEVDFALRDYAEILVKQKGA